MSDINQDLAELGLAPLEPVVVGVIAPEPEPALKAVGPDHPPHPMGAQWAKWRPMLADAMDGSHHRIEEVERGVFQHRLQFWPGEKAAMVTEIVDYSGAKAIQVMWMAGDIEDAIAMAPGISAFGRLMGCTEVLIEGRPGWQRVLKPHGFELWSVTLRKAL